MKQDSDNEYDPSRQKSKISPSLKGNDNTLMPKYATSWFHNSFDLYKNPTMHSKESIVLLLHLNGDIQSEQ
jgi:hypothetical protein